MDYSMNYEEAIKLVREQGFQGVIDKFNEEFPGYDLYSCSTSWEDSDEYILKLRGTTGDVVVGWDHVKYRPSLRL